MAKINQSGPSDVTAEPGSVVVDAQGDVYEIVPQPVGEPAGTREHGAAVAERKKRRS